MANPKIPLGNLITLGACNLPELRTFYEKLGFPRLMGDGELVAFELRGIVLALFPVDKLARDGGEKPESRQGGIRFTLGIMVEQPEEVDELVEVVRQAGGRITKEAVDAEFFEGRSAYFADPEDNYWEISWAAADNRVVAAARRAAGLKS